MCPLCNTCQGNVAVYCGVDLNALQDCSVLGATCQDGRCLEPGDVVCDDHEVSCDEQGRPRSCDDLERHGPVCADFGLSCALDDFLFYAGCQGTGEPCTTTSSSELELDGTGTGCEGEVLHGCFDGRADSIDCRNLGPDFSCQMFGEKYFCGLASECDPDVELEDGRYSCEGTEIVFCDAGQITRVDCSSFGFTTCVEGLRSGVCQ